MTDLRSEIANLRRLKLLAVRDHSPSCRWHHQDECTCGASEAKGEYADRLIDAATRLLDAAEWGLECTPPSTVIVMSRPEEWQAFGAGRDSLKEELAAVTAERNLLAKLAADTPQFYNPLEAMAAKTLRDSILAQEGRG